MRRLALVLALATSATVAAGGQAATDLLFENIDESRIYITGISDGGTGVYYMALKEPTLWSSYLPLNGSIAVVRSPQNGADGEMYGNNLSGAPFVFRPQAGAGHNTAWWPTEREPYETFVREHARVAHPTKVSWETESTT